MPSGEPRQFSAARLQQLTVIGESVFKQYWYTPNKWYTSETLSKLERKKTNKQKYIGKLKNHVLLWYFSYLVVELTLKCLAK